MSLMDTENHSCILHSIGLYLFRLGGAIWNLVVSIVKNSTVTHLALN